MILECVVLTRVCHIGKEVARCGVCLLVFLFRARQEDPLGWVAGSRFLPPCNF